MIPVFETDRLVLRGAEVRDLEAVAGFYQSERSRMIGGPKDRNEAWRVMCAGLGHWQLRGYGMWTLHHKDADRACGACGFLNHEGWDEPELGWNLHDGFEGQGLAMEAAVAARAYGARHFGLNGVISYIDATNDRSRALAERLGASFERDGMVMGHPCHVYRHPKELA